MVKKKTCHCMKAISSPSECKLFALWLLSTTKQIANKETKFKQGNKMDQNLISSMPNKQNKLFLVITLLIVARKEENNIPHGTVNPHGTEHPPRYCTHINRAGCPCEEIFILIFKAYGPNAVRSMRLEYQNKYFPFGPKSRLIRALLYTYTNKIA